MGWNSKQRNEVRYPESDLQQAYEAFKDVENSYEQQLKRRMSTLDCSIVQEAWNRFLRLRKSYGYSR